MLIKVLRVYNLYITELIITFTVIFNRLVSDIQYNTLKPIALI